MNGDNRDASSEGYDSNDDSVFGAMDGNSSGSDSESVSQNNDDDDDDYDSESSDDDGDSDNESEDESITDEGEGNEEDWLQDPGEKARRIWHYWKPIVSVKTSKDDYPYFRKALWQVSSCAVERVFSQLLEIRRKCKDWMHEDILEVRMMERCNGDVALSILANQTMEE